MIEHAVMQIMSLWKQFGGDFGLKDISLDLKQGEIHVIIGENGSGKSALMKIISGLESKDAGVILLNGLPVQFSTIHEARKAGIFYQHQDAELFSNLSVAENVFFDMLQKHHHLFFTIDPLELRAKCQSLFKELRIPIDPEILLEELGYAERQLISALKAYVADAQIVIFDEPTAAMGEVERSIFFNLIEKLRAKVNGIFYISHRMDEIERIGDRVTAMHMGKITGSNYCSNTNRNSLLQMMTMEIHDERYPRIQVPQGKAILTVKNIRSEHILRDVSFSLKKGEILGITGLMGSGRTRLAGCLFGEYPISSGKILIEEKQVHINHPLDAMKNGISLIPEDRIQNAIFPHHNLLTNTTIASLKRFLDGVSLDEIVMNQLTHDYAERLNIVPGGLDDILATYSGGNQQKVMVARWFMHRTKIYIMDEPTRGVDAASKIDIYNSMNDLISKGASVILISSEIEEILGMCDRILVLGSGRIVCDMPRAKATKELILDYATNEE